MHTENKMPRRRPSYHPLSEDPSDWELIEDNDEENESKIDAYEERMNRPMTDADQAKIDNARDDNDSRMWE